MKSGFSFPIFGRRGVPGQRFIDAVDLEVGGPFEDPGEPGLRVDIVEPGGLDQGVGDGGGLAAAGRAHEEIIFPAQGDQPHRAFGRVIVDFEEAMPDLGPQVLEAGQRMADRRRQRGLAGDPGQLRLQPALQLIESRRGLGPADRHTPLGRLVAGLRLDGVERGDPFQRLGGDRGALGGMDIEELPPHMLQAGNLAERAGAGHLAKPGIAV